MQTSLTGKSSLSAAADDLATVRSYSVSGPTDLISISDVLNQGYQRRFSTEYGPDFLLVGGREHSSHC